MSPSIARIFPHVTGSHRTRCVLLAALALLGSSPAAALNVAVCESPASGEALLDTAAFPPLYVGAEQRVQLWQGQGAAPPGCHSLQLPRAVAALRWLGLVAHDAAAAAPQQLVLQGSFEAAVRVSEIELAVPAEPAPATAPLLFGGDLLPRFELQPFGVEERVTLTPTGAIECRAGMQPAGVVLRTAAPWTAAQAQELELQLQGGGEIQLAIADAARAAQQAPLVLGTLPLRAEDDARHFRYRLPLQAEDWQSLTLACPLQPASFTLQALRLLPQELPQARQRSAWFWAPALWQQAPQRLLDLAVARQIQRLFLTVPVTDGIAQDVQALQHFVAAAHARGLQVWPVLGDPRHVLGSERAALQAQVAAYLQYNAASASDARLDGLQLDIEPHLLPGFALAQPQWRARWLDTVLAVQQQLAGRLPLDLVLPVWWGSHPAWGEALLESLQGPGLSLTIMNYRTSEAALRDGAQPFLAWAQRQEVPVSMALEAGSIGPDEQRLQFAQAEAGELLWLQLGDYRLLAWAGAEQAAAPGLPVYRLQRQDRAAASAITFGGDLLRLEAVAAALEPEWRSAPAYAGLAIHGLDEVLLQAAQPPPPAAK